ncbi:MarR family winged helix-turn-helix transcriptional regulator [Stappia sp. ES.058]|uniref:MarR family winged helix-turn-helix transcriptional regulator n=1 Tax=Stappia sp. ES.058 TaxID=1881061 RepID=UPI00087DC916|nr:MarR family transcriptional regulator [Stappia sp. ES.058]SDT93871.1 DNA-binding transcriptional regulator, MarR family [Stappia sp. ES.058]
METLAFSLMDVASLLEKRFDRSLSAVRGVSLGEYRLLRSLSAFPQARATRVDLARAVGLTPSAVTRALKPLEKLGFVTTEKSDRDARQSLAKLAPAGETLLSDAAGVVADVAAGLPQTTVTVEQLDALYRGLGGQSRQKSEVAA